MAQAIVKNDVYAEEMRKTCLEYLWLHMQQMKTLEDEGGPITIASGEGCYIQDLEGNTYLDLMAGAGNMILGYSVEPVKRAIREQLEKVPFVMQAFFANIPAIELSQELAKITPADLNTSFFSCNGSDANETAIKIARQYFVNQGERKFKVISRSANSYQGCHLTTLSTSGTVSRRVKFEPLGPGFIRVPPPYCYRCYYKLTYPECDTLCARIIERVIEDEGPESICAFIGDTLSVYGTTPPPNYFTILREICDKHNILMICDEVVTGIGRTGKMFACDGHWDFIPDILTLGKGVSAGYMPLSATIISNKVKEVFRGGPEEHKEFMSLYTYGGIPAVCAAGVATLREITGQRWVEQVARLGQKVAERLKRLEEESPFVGHSRGVGLCWNIEIVKDKKTKEFFDPGKLKKALNAALMTKGIATYFMGYPPILGIVPPYIITEDQIMGAIDIIEAQVNSVCRGL